MTKLYVAEYPGPGALPSGDSIINALPVPPTAEQVVDYTAGVTPSTQFQPSTTLVEVSADSICSIAWGLAPVATVNNMRLIAGERKLVRVPQFAATSGSAPVAFKVSAITNT